MSNSGGKWGCREQVKVNPTQGVPPRGRRIHGPHTEPQESLSHLRTCPRPTLLPLRAHQTPPNEHHRRTPKHGLPPIRLDATGVFHLSGEGDSITLSTFIVGLVAGETGIRF